MIQEVLTNWTRKSLLGRTEGAYKGPSFHTEGEGPLMGRSLPRLKARKSLVCLVALAAGRGLEGWVTRSSLAIVLKTEGIPEKGTKRVAWHDFNLGWKARSHCSVESDFGERCKSGKWSRLGMMKMMMMMVHTAHVGARHSSKSTAFNPCKNCRREAVP